jgi:queuine tRNA-ribosyltransferase
VVEVTPAELKAEQGGPRPPLLLDVREPHEWRQGRIPGSLHIPMNQVPARLEEIERNASVIVVCAHGQRSYNVAAYLLRQGFQARSLRGGVVEWYVQRGEIETG